MLDDGLIRQSTVETQTQDAYILDVERMASMVLDPQFASVAVGELDAVKALPVLEARKSRFLSRLDAAEESGERLIEAAKIMLQGGGIQLAERVRLVLAQIAEVRPLRLVRDALAGVFVGSDALFERGVVDPSRLPEKEI
jgi:hypothetical protein